MRLRRMNKSSNVGDVGRLIRAQCVQNLMHRSNTESSKRFKHIKVNLVPALEQECVPRGALGAIIGTRANGQCRAGERLGAWVANCSSCGLAGSALWALA